MSSSPAITVTNAAMRRPSPGSSLGIVAPSSTILDLNQAHLEIGIRKFRDWGLEPRISSNATLPNEKLLSSAQARLDDFSEMLHNPSVSMIMAVYGGNNSIDLLEAFPYDLFRKANKPFVGYSDITALLNAVFTVTGVPTFHGPGFATFCDPCLSPYTSDCFEAAIFDERPCRFEDPGSHCEDDWYTLSDPASRKYEASTWKTYREGEVVARVVGGNTTTFLALSGTQFMPSMTGSILLLENVVSEPYRVLDRQFAQLRLMGALDEIVGLIIGKQGQSSSGSIRCLLDKHFSNVQCPILYDVSCSHTSPMITLPIGSPVRLDATHKVIEFLPPMNGPTASQLRELDRPAIS